MLYNQPPAYFVGIISVRMLSLILNGANELQENSRVTRAYISADKSLSHTRLRNKIQQAPKTELVEISNFSIIKLD